MENKTNKVYFMLEFKDILGAKIDFWNDVHSRYEWVTFLVLTKREKSVHEG